MAKVRLENTPTDWIAVRKPQGWWIYPHGGFPFPIAIIGTVGKTGDCRTSAIMGHIWEVENPRV